MGGQGLGAFKISLAAEEIKPASVWSDKSYWPFAWKAWRSEVSPNENVRELRIVLEKKESGAMRPLTAHFIPR